MEKKRLRIFAGANGSGKSTFLKSFEKNFNAKLHIYINADEIEIYLNKSRELDFKKYTFNASTKSIQKHFELSTFPHNKDSHIAFHTNFSVVENKLKIDNSIQINSYIAADIADHIRQNLILNHLSFSFETVMSNANKIELLKNAKQNI